MSKRKIMLIIAGSDSGGGAGIQCDIKTASAHGVFAASAITAITAQNTRGVKDVEILSGEMVTKQIEMVLDDIGADVIKIGMLANSEIINSVYDILIKKARNIPIILDTVMIAKGGAELLQQDAIQTMCDKLLPIAFVATPNIVEAEIIAGGGMKINTPSDMEKIAEKISKLGAKYVLMKGGHSKTDEINDILYDGERFHYYINERIKTSNLHGTGCCLSSSIACNIALGQNIDTATDNAIRFVRNAIKFGDDIGSKHKPLNFFVKHSLDYK